MEQTYVMVKPDGVQRGLVGEVISRIEKRGLKISRMDREADTIQKVIAVGFENHLRTGSCSKGNRNPL